MIRRSKYIFGLQNRHPFIRAAILAVWMTAAIAVAVPAAQAVLQPGDIAPPFTLKDSKGTSYRLDSSSTSPTLLVFVKPGDRYTSEALHALDHLFENQPELGKGLSRWVVASRMSAPGEAQTVEGISGSGWPVLLDADDRIYHKYLIIATPTVVLVGSDRRVAAVNPGYDLGMEIHLRKELAKALGISTPQEAKEPTAEEVTSAMTIQMGRRLAARGLYENALTYYEKAGKEGSLTPQGKLEMAEVYLEVKQPDQALEILKPLQSNPDLASRVNSLIQRAEAIKMNKGQPSSAPKVVR